MMLKDKYEKCRNLQNKICNKIQIECYKCKICYNMPNTFLTSLYLFHVAHLMFKIRHTNRFQGICVNSKQVATLFIRIHNER